MKHDTHRRAPPCRVCTTFPGLKCLAATENPRACQSLSAQTQDQSQQSSHPQLPSELLTLCFPSCCATTPVISHLLYPTLSLSKPPHHISSTTLYPQPFLGKFPWLSCSNHNQPGSVPRTLPLLQPSHMTVVLTSSCTDLRARRPGGYHFLYPASKLSCHLQSLTCMSSDSTHSPSHRHLLAFWSHI